MKFGKRLKRQIEETLPQWRDKFLSYKELKKHIKAISDSSSLSETDRPVKKARVSDESLVFQKDQKAFIDLLNAEIEKFNAFYCEQEEEYIIRQKDLLDEVEILRNNKAFISEAEYTDEMIKLKKEVVNLHGEMVLLQNYSSLNYMGIGKILKKYDKRTGGLLRHLFIQDVLKQPFFITEQLSNLIRECENTLHTLFADYPFDDPFTSNAKSEEGSITGGQEKNQSKANPSKGEEEEVWNPEIIHRSIKAALYTLREIRKGSSTYSAFSLPPMSATSSSSGDEISLLVDEGNNTIPTPRPLIPICP